MQNDIYEIQKILFVFIYSWGYLMLIFIVLFLVFYYSMMIYILPQIKKKYISEHIKYDQYFDTLLQELTEKKEILSRSEFYEKCFLLFQCMLFKKYKHKKIFFQTFFEIQNDISDTTLLSYIKEIYYHRYDNKKEDNLLIREKILKKIKDVL